jgi:alkanesulfonate monooxygenase SsuD/methylene tetrahydromethanopterin reductase-like flavin-dependent oxidoreductase (luciferase family)
VPHPWVEADRGAPRFALHGGPYADWPQFVDFIQRTESLGFDAYWMHDHPWRNPGCWTTLASLASITRRLRLGSLVNCVLYRSAVEVARAAADVDRVSGGRVILGLGAGDFEEESRRLGITMPPARERVRMLGEMIQSVKTLWGEGDPLQPSGADGQSLTPGPVQSPHIPLLIAGLGPTTLRYVAEYADAVNLPPVSSATSTLAGHAAHVLTVADFGQKLTILDAHCRDRSRPPASVLRSHMSPVVLAETETGLAEKLNGLPERIRTLYIPFAIVGTPGQAIETYESLGMRGIDYFIGMILGNDLETVDLLANVRPALEKKLAAAST